MEKLLKFWKEAAVNTFLLKWRGDALSVAVSKTFNYIYHCEIALLGFGALTFAIRDIIILQLL